jgi:hypothetical protein
MKLILPNYIKPIRKSKRRLLGTVKLSALNLIMYKPILAGTFKSNRDPTVLAMEWHPGISLEHFNIF